MANKYIDSEKLIAEIEKQKAAIEQNSIGRYTSIGFIKACDKILFTIASLQQEQPELPTNLDEAAEDSWAVYEYRESPRGLYSTCYIDGFKAGVEYLAGQGETHEAEIIESVPFGGTKWKRCVKVWLDDQLQAKGDKVIVQIRKK